VFWFRDERIVNIRVFTNRGAALAAVGLTE
jgi:hypothetical protein